MSDLQGDLGRERPCETVLLPPTCQKEKEKEEWETVPCHTCPWRHLEGGGGGWRRGRSLPALPPSLPATWGMGEAKWHVSMQRRHGGRRREAWQTVERRSSEGARKKGILSLLSIVWLQKIHLGGGEAPKVVASISPLSPAHLSSP